MAYRQWLHIDDRGRLVLPAELSERLGLQPGMSVLVEEEAHALRIKRSPHSLARVYVEVTNKCNLSCRFCIRNTWNVAFGLMREDTFARVMEGIRAFSPLPEVFFGGWGEPLVHPHIVDWVREAKELGARTLLITNGILLDEEKARGLIDAGLDVLWVSIDGATPETYADVRLGEYLPTIIENLERLRDLKVERFGRSPWSGHPKLSVAFVAMKRNIRDLPQVLELGRRLGAVDFSISNLMPFTADMRDEVLYRDTMYVTTGDSSTDARPHVYLPRMDVNDETWGTLVHLLQGEYHLEFFGNDLGRDVDTCPFIERGSLTVRWDGRVSPCWELLYDHVSYLGDRQRVVKAHHVGDLREQTLAEIWNDAEYKRFRERVVSFEFPPCVYCNGCELAGTNQEDCYGNPAPTCGGCLWAQGFIRCP